MGESDALLLHLFAEEACGHLRQTDFGVLGQRARVVFQKHNSAVDVACGNNGEDNDRPALQTFYGIKVVVALPGRVGTARFDKLLKRGRNPPLGRPWLLSM